MQTDFHYTSESDTFFKKKKKRKAHFVLDQNILNEISERMEQVFPCTYVEF